MKKILIIDDTKSIRNQVVTILSSAGYEMSDADGGITGIEAINKIKPDLIICDIVMPEVNGYEVLKEVRKNEVTATIPFIFITIRSERTDLRQAMAGGADDYLTKPFSREELIEAVKSQFEKQKKLAVKMKELTKNRLSHLLATSPAVIYSCNGKYCDEFSFVSDNITSLIGYKKENFLKNSDFWLDLIHSEDRERFLSGIKKAPEKGYMSLEYRVLNIDGTYRWIYDERKIIEKKNSREATGSWLDISEIKKAQKELMESEGKLSSLLKAIPDYMIMLDKDLNIIWANRNFSEFFGDEIFGKKCYEAFNHKEYVCSAHVCSTTKAFHYGLVHRHTIEVSHKEGEKLYFHCTSSVAMRDKDGRPEAVLEILRDETARNKAEKAFIYRLEIEKLITRISNNFINISPSEFEIEIRDALREIGEFIGVDRASFALFTEDFQRFDILYNWCRNNTEKVYNTYKNLTFEKFTWLTEQFKSGQCAYVPSLSLIPPEGEAFKKFLLSEGIKSILAIPVVSASFLHGYIGFSSEREEKSWEEEDIMLLKLPGEIFLNAFERKETELKLNQWNLMEVLVTNIATRFVNMNRENQDRNIYHSLKALGEFTGVDRVYIYTFSSDGLKFKEVFEWYVPECSPIKDEVKKLNPQSFKWLKASFMSSDYVNIPSVAELPEEAVYEKKYWTSQGVKSILLLTLKVRDKFLGSFGFSSERKEKKWGDIHIRLVKMTGDIFTNVILRRKPEKIEVRAADERSKYHNMVGKSRVMQDVYSLIDDLADVQSTVLITGESGTGKELVAQALHEKGIRRHKPIVKVNCSALSENLQESELFGHVKGAFTSAIKTHTGRFQKADGGTIFLDEIGDISLSMQMKLLRVLQEKEFERVGDSTPIKVDVRVIAATNQDLLKKIEEEVFRKDLYYRLKVVEIKLPPFRDRMEDLLLLMDHFINKFNSVFNKKINSVSDDVMEKFMNYSWPGNVREMEHMLEHAFIVCHKETITMENLPQEFQARAEVMTPDISGGDFNEEKKIREALDRAKWNKAGAARLVGMSRPTFYKKAKEYGIF